MIAIVSYNELPLSQKLKQLLSLADQKIMVFGNIFNPKSPSSVRTEDRVYLQVKKNFQNLEKIIIFVGKKSSGSLEMVSLFCRELNQQKLFFVLCSHDLDEKINLLESLGFNSQNYLVFRDNKYLIGKPCNEEIILLGVAFEHITEGGLKNTE